MKVLTLTDVIECFTSNRIEAPGVLTNAIIDSRQAQPDSLFVALPGEKTDGHEFVVQTFQQGAIAAIIDKAVAGVDEDRIIKVGQTTAEQTKAIVNRPPFCIQVEDSLKGLQQLASFWRDKFPVRVIGVTGSVGKSTTKELIWSVLSSRFSTLKNEGNYNNEIGLPLTLLKLNDEHERVVLEMGMYDLGEITLLCDIANPHVGVITNVEPVHLERLGTIERITQAKTELVQALPPASADGVAILNYDDPRVQAMAGQTDARVVTYGLFPEADLWASDVISMGLEGVKFVFHYQDEVIHARVPLLGRHSVHTALRAALVGLVEGLDWEEIIGGLQTLANAAQLRLIAVAGPNGSILLDDTYNASPSSTFAALNLLDDLAATKKIAVLGDMMELGSYEEEGHRKVGCRTADTVDLLITIGRRARIIAEEARACGLDASVILELENNQAAIDYLKSVVEPDNIILVKGSNSQNMGEIVSALIVNSKNHPSDKQA